MPSNHHRICLVSDYFIPQLGGIELHIYHLAQELIRLGHHVIVITRAYGNTRVGIRVLNQCLRVYHLPMPIIHDGNTFPCVFPSLPLLYDIYKREQIEIVHGHQMTSTMTHEAMLHAKLMGLRTVFTDHSMFGFSDPISIILNKLLKFSLCTVDCAVAVSEACKENLMLRGTLEPARVIAIPNAVEAKKFTPPLVNNTMNIQQKENHDTITVVVLSRLAFRKGIDLVTRVIPLACERFPNIKFIIGGGGPKRLLLDEMIERYSLKGRVEILGEIPHHRVRDVLIRGKVFLNCSLTEAFCIAILEAACAGLIVVSTKVGGVPEVLPPDMIRFPDPDKPIVQGLVDALARAIEDIDKIDPWKNHQILAHRYSWENVAKRISNEVYDVIKKSPQPTMIDNLQRYRGMGWVAGILAVWVVALDSILITLLQWLRPNVDLAPEIRMS
jgi:phosphatidylinositol glycan class A protein